MNPASPPAVQPSVQQTCEHAAEEARRFTASNGVAHFRVQCLDCGAHVRSVKKAELRCAPDQLAEWDEALRLDYWKRQSEARRAQYEAERQQESAEWWARYDGYLQSTAWERKRDLVLRRDDYRCQANVDERCARTASQVHHLTYAHLGQEPLFDLIAVCTPCHGAITAMDRERRGS